MPGGGRHPAAVRVQCFWGLCDPYLGPRAPGQKQSVTLAEFSSPDCLQDGRLFEWLAQKEAQVERVESGDGR